ncbi:MAG: hypothetical protein ACP5U1_01115 [Desulfomonilaceae bacterium]
MDLDRRIDDLVEAGWHVLDTDCDERALLHWKRAAAAFLEDFLGRRHAVTESFIDCWKTRYRKETDQQLRVKDSKRRSQVDQDFIEV